MGSTKADRPYGSFRMPPDEASAAVPAPARPGRWARTRAALPRSAARNLVAAALLLALGVTVGSVLRPLPQPLSEGQVTAIARQVVASASPKPDPAVAIYERLRPAVVSVRVRLGSPSGTEAQGTGVVISEAGDILTSQHLVGGAARIRVIFANGTESIAGIVAQQPENDIALIRAATPPRPLVPAVLGDSSALRVGEQVYAIGDPFGLTGSLSAGVVSGLGRTINVAGRPPLADLIQFDAAVNPGSSGGPLVDRKGDVVGIVTGIAQSVPTGREVFAGVSFAVKIENAGGAAGAPPH